MWLTPGQLAEYNERGLAMDATIRKLFKIPANRYYTVAVYPPKVAGRVTIERERVVGVKKISKSDVA